MQNHFSPPCAPTPASQRSKPTVLIHLWKEYFNQCNPPHPKMMLQVWEARGSETRAAGPLSRETRFCHSLLSSWTLVFFVTPSHPRNASLTLWSVMSPKCSEACVTLLLSMTFTCPPFHGVTAWLNDGPIRGGNLVSSSCS